MHWLSEHLVRNACDTLIVGENLVPSSLVRIGAKASECGYCGQKSDGVPPIPASGRPTRARISSSCAVTT